MPRLFVIILSVILFAYQTVGNAKTEKIILATAEWQPYISEKSPEHGRFAEIVTTVFKEMGMTTELIFAPWKRVEILVKNGDAYAGIPYTYTEERHKVFDYSASIMNSKNVFFYNKKMYPKGISYSQLAELRRYRISGVTGYWYEDLFKENKLNVEYVTSDEQSITKLYFNRVDLVATDELVGTTLIQKLYPHDAAQFAVVERPILTAPLHLLVSKKYPHAAQITEKFNTTLESLRKKGVIVF